MCDTQCVGGARCGVNCGLRIVDHALDEFIANLIDQGTCSSLSIDLPPCIEKAAGDIPGGFLVVLR